MMCLAVRQCNLPQHCTCHENNQTVMHILGTDPTCIDTTQIHVHMYARVCACINFTLWHLTCM